MIELYAGKGTAKYKICITDKTLPKDELNRVIDPHWREIKKNEIKNLIKASSGLFFESLSNVEIAPPGEDISISFEAINRSPNNIKLKRCLSLIN